MFSPIQEERFDIISGLLNVLSPEFNTFKSTYHEHFVAIRVHVNQVVLTSCFHRYKKNVLFYSLQKYSLSEVSYALLDTRRAFRHH